MERGGRNHSTLGDSKSIVEVQVLEQSNSLMKISKSHLRTFFLVDDICYGIMSNEKLIQVRLSVS